jgi:hypothetical protein
MDASKAKKEASKIKITIGLVDHVHLLFPAIEYVLNTELFGRLSTHFYKIRNEQAKKSDR